MEKAVRKEELMVRTFISDIIRDEVANAVRIILEEAKPKPEVVKYLKIDEAIGYIKGKGLKMGKSNLYKLTAAKQIPFKRWGDRQIVFDVDELDGWIEKQLENKPNPVAKAVAASARRK